MQLQVKFDRTQARGCIHIAAESVGHIGLTSASRPDCWAATPESGHLTPCPMLYCLMQQAPGFKIGACNCPSGTQNSHVGKFLLCGVQAAIISPNQAMKHSQAGQMIGLYSVRLAPGLSVPSL